MDPQNKRKDLMTSAFDDFWASDYKIPGPKINTPKPKNFEDDAFDSFWGRNNYAPQPRMPNMNASTGSRYVANVRPVQYQQQVKPMSAADRAEIMKQELILQQIRARQGLRSSQNTGQAIGGVIKAGQFGARATKYAVREGAPIAIRGAKAGYGVARAGVGAGISGTKAGYSFARRAASAVANRGAYNTIRGTSAGRTGAGVLDWLKNKMPKGKPPAMSQADVSHYADQLE